MSFTAGQCAARDQSGFHSLAQSNVFHRVSLAMLHAWLWLWLRLR